MMQSELAALLDNDEEWFNIPPILRRLLRQMSEEDEVSRKLIELLREEQKETNALLRRLFQKQTNMEIDSARNAMMLAIKAKGDDEHKLADSVKSLKKKVVKNEEDLNHLEEMVKHLTDEDLIVSRVNARIAESIASVESKIQGITSQCEVQKKLIQNHALQFNELTESLNYLKQQHTKVDKLVVEHVTKTQYLERKVDSLVSDSNRYQECQQNYSRLAKEFSDYEAINEKRFKSMLNSFEKIESLCEGQRTVLEGSLQRATTDTAEKLSLLRGEMHRISADAHNLIASSVTRLKGDLGTVQDSVQSLKKASSESFEFMEKTLTKVKTNTKQLSQLESVVNELERQYFTQSDSLHEKNNRETEQVRTLIHEKEQATAEVCHLKDQIVQLDGRIESMQDFFGKDNAAVQENIEQLQARVHELSQAQLRTNEQNERLHKLVSNVSSAMDHLEKVITQQHTSSERQEEQKRMLAESREKERVSALCEHLHATLAQTTKALHQEVNERHALGESCERQFKAVASKIATVEESLQSTVQKLDSFQQKHLSWKSWQEEALKDLSPALIEMEAVKRRIATSEAKLSEICCDIGSGKAGMSVRLMEESMEESNQRVLELSCRLLSFEKRLLSLSNDATEMGHQLENSASANARLGQDVSRALEGIVKSENMISHMKADTEARFEALTSTLTKLDERLHKPGLTNVSGSLPLSNSNEGGLEEWKQRTEEELRNKQQELTTRLDELHHVVQKLEDAFAVQALQLDSELTCATKEDSSCSLGNHDTSEVALSGKEQAQHQSRLEHVHHEIQSLWQTIETMRSSVLSASAEATKIKFDENASSPQGLSKESSQHLLYDPTEMHRVVETSVQASVIELSNRLGENFSEIINKQYDFILDRHRTWSEKLENKIDALRSTLRELQDQVDAPGNAVEQQGRLDAMETGVTLLLRKQKLLSDDMHSLQGNLQQLQDRLKEPITTWDGAPIRSDGDSRIVYTQLGERVQRLEGEIERLSSTTLSTRPPLAPLYCSGVVESEPAKEGEGRLEALWGEVAALQERVVADLCTKVFLEEEMQTLGRSLRDLIACKEDKKEVEAKIEDLHQLITDEFDIQLRELREDVANTMASKIGLRELQEILETDSSNPT